MTRQTAFAALAVATALAAAVAGTGAGQAAAAPHGARVAPARGTPGTWTKVSTGAVAIEDQPSVARTPDGDLHLVYAAASGNLIRHSTIHTNGRLGTQNDVLGTAWSQLVPDPIVLSNEGDDLQVVFGGIQGSGNPFFDAGRMYAASSPGGGTSWSLDTDAATISADAHAQDGTAATTLDTAGTPISGFALNNQLVWHAGQSGAVADGHLDAAPGLALSHPTFVRSGSAVWAGWLQQGPTAATTGFFAMQISPTVGTPAKAPGSSVGTQTVTWLTRTPLAARVGGGVFEAYCVGAPTCTKVRVWKVGTSRTADIPHSRFATTIALSAAPSGRLWVAWADNLPKVRAVRTSKSGLRIGVVRTAGLPRGGAAHSLAIDGALGRGDIVLNAGNGLWHTQVLAGLTLHASPATWRHGGRQRVVFTVSDARDAVSGARVRVGSSACTTRAAGTCSITFVGSFGAGRHTARATRSGYAPATAGLRVR